MSTSPPETGGLALPTFFLDRSLGRLIVAAGLRAAGIRVITLAEHYGIPTDERVSDADWLHECGRHGWAAIKAEGSAPTILVLRTSTARTGPPVQGT